MDPLSPIDLQARVIADRQNDNITYAQLLAVGFTKEAIRHRVRTGRMFRVYPKVYSVGGPPRSPLDWATAAVLACGTGAGLSHHAALCAWGLQHPWHPPPFDVTVPRDGWIYHRSREVFESDRDRDADTLEAGHVTVRLTKCRLRGQPDREAERLHNILRARRAGR